MFMGDTFNKKKHGYDNVITMPVHDLVSSITRTSVLTFLYFCTLTPSLRNICCDHLIHIHFYFHVILLYIIINYNNLMLGHRFDIAIDYRFIIGRTKPTCYRLCNRFN